MLNTLAWQHVRRGISARWSGELRIEISHLQRSSLSADLRPQRSASTSERGWLPQPRSHAVARTPCSSPHFGPSRRSDLSQNGYPETRNTSDISSDNDTIRASPREAAARADDGRAAAPSAGGFPDANFHLDQGRIASQSFENEHLPVIGGCIDIGQGKEKGGGKGKKGPLSAQQLVFRNLCGNFAKNEHFLFCLKRNRKKVRPSEMGADFLNFKE